MSSDVVNRVVRRLVRRGLEMEEVRRRVGRAGFRAIVRYHNRLVRDEILAKVEGGHNHVLRGDEVALVGKNGCTSSFVVTRA